MNTPKNLKYASSDEWVLIEGDVATLGVSDYAQDQLSDCLLYTSDAADDLLCVDLGGRRLIKKKKHTFHTTRIHIH